MGRAEQDEAHGKDGADPQVDVGSQLPAGSVDGGVGVRAEQLGERVDVQGGNRRSDHIGPQRHHRVVEGFPNVGEGLGVRGCGRRRLVHRGDPFAAAGVGMTGVSSASGASSGA